MGIYVVTGGTKGIGGKTVELLRDNGHETINIDIDGGDINADLGTAEGRLFSIAQVHERCPDGLDGLVCNHGIVGLPGFKLSYILSVNYFGALAVIDGLYDLLKMKNGKCAVTVSGAIAYANRKNNKYFVDGLLNNCGDEARIGRLVDTFEHLEDGVMGNTMYQASKIALARWVRRVSATWAAHGVSINAVAPGGVDTTIMHGFRPPENDTFVYPMPAYFGQRRAMAPVDLAEVLAFLVTCETNGISGAVLFCDAGANTVIDTERYY